MSPSPAAVLTPRHIELVALVASGYTYTQIAEMKFMHINTVRNRLEAARKLVGAISVSDLCILSAQDGAIVRDQNGYVPVVDPYAAE